MGYQIEVSPDRKAIRQKLASGARATSLDEAEKTAPRIMRLIETLHGVRRPNRGLEKKRQGPNLIPLSVAVSL
jgi:hypothetical protein